MDFSNSQIVSLHTGQTKIQDGHFKLIHSINLKQYEQFLSDISPVLNLETTQSQILFPLISHEIQQIRNLLHNLQPRIAKRSLDFIGKGWKWIAGNPDHDDFVTIKEKITDVLKNNNKQVIINELYNERINNITRIQNEIQNLLKNNNKINYEIISNLKYKIKIVKEELENINYAIHWAKLGTINSFILSKNEIELATKVFNEQKLPYTTIEEALDFADIKVLSNSTSILYIINIPLTTNEIYENLLIKPIKKKNIVTETLYEVILRNNEKLYGTTNKCKTFNNLSICNSKNIVNITNDTCIPNLLKSLPATCNKINNHHIPTIDEISTGIMLLNQFIGTLEFDNTTHNLNGTFLVKFHNMTITLNGIQYISKEASMIKPLPAILQTSPKENEYRELLSLEMMKDLHINNTNKIHLLQTENDNQQVTTYSLISVLGLLITIAIICKILPRRNNTEIIIEQPTTKTNGPVTIIDRFSVPEVNYLQYPSSPKFNNLPYF